MKKIVFLTIMLVSALTMAAQEIKSDIAGEFSKVNFTGKLDVVLIKSSSNAIDIKLHNADVDKISWNVKNGELNVKLKANTQKTSSADVKIYYKDINAIKTTNAKVKASDTVEKGIFSISASNGGVISLDVDTKDLTVQADGNSAIMIAGDTDYLNVDANSKSKVDARNLEALSVNAKARYASEIFVWATDKLDATAGTNSNIYYKEMPEVLKVSEKMMGTVGQFNLQ